MYFEETLLLYREDVLPGFPTPIPAGMGLPAWLRGSRCWPSGIGPRPYLPALGFP